MVTSQVILSVFVSLLCRLSSECGSLHESLAGVEGRVGGGDRETLFSPPPPLLPYLLTFSPAGSFVLAGETQCTATGGTGGEIRAMKVLIDVGMCLFPHSPPSPLSHSAATDCLQSSLQRVMSELDSTLTELEGTRTSNMLLKQQVRGRQAQRGPVLVLV